MNTDPNDLLRDDLEKFQNASGQGMDTSLPAMIELAFLSLAGLTALCWFVAIFWVPDPIDGPVWMGLGMLGLVLFGLPAGLIYVLRRGAGDVIMAMMREYAR